MIIIKNALIVNEGRKFKGSVKIKGERIFAVYEGDPPIVAEKEARIIDAGGKLLIPGVIDDQVHFRDPGLTHKEDIYSGSKAAVAGGITSFMDMPNVIPQSTTLQLLEERYKMAANKSLANFSFYIGATNNNIDEILKTDPTKVCGVKVFMGSSTGNMLVDKQETLEEIFSKSPLLVATHCEDEETIQKNIKQYRSKYGEDVPIEEHPNIRSEEACYKSSSLAVGLAKKHGTRLHVLHLSTGKEMELFANNMPSKDKKITAEVCVHHLWFDNRDYNKKGVFIKWNPAIKTPHDKKSLQKALNENYIDVVATDHAPHLRAEKQNTYFKSSSGGAMVQHALVAMLELYKKKLFTLEKIVEKMCHAPADIFKIKERGYIRPGYYADLVIVDLENDWTVTKENVLSKCGWSPFEDETFSSKVMQTFVNGNRVYNNGTFDESRKGQRLFFER